MIEKLLSNSRKKNIIIILFMLLVFFASLLNSYINYTENKKTLYLSIDKILKNVAFQYNDLLPANFHDLALNKDSISAEEDRRNIQRLSRYINVLDVVYGYTTVVKDDKLYFTSSSSTEEEIKKKEEILYFDHYDSADASMFDIIKTDTITYLNIKDKWGSFRSVNIPMKTRKNNRYVLSADIEISFINKQLDEYLYQIFVMQIIIFSLLIMIGMYFFQISKIEILEIIKIKESLEDQIDEKTKKLNESLEVFDENVIASNTDLKGTITYVSAALCKISGYTKEELLGKAHSILRHSNMSADIYYDLWKTIKSGNIWNGKIKNCNKDGGYYWVSISIFPVFDIHQNIIAYRSVQRDITEEFTHIQRGEILENSLNEIYILSATTYQFLYINKVAENNIGYSYQEMQSMTPVQIGPYSNIDILIDKLKTLDQDGIEYLSFTSKHIRKDKTLYDVDVHIQKTSYEGGDAYVAIMLDVTGRIQSEQLLLEQKEVLQHQAHHDALTDLPNRILLNDRLAKAINKAKRYTTKIAVLFIDLDHFKEINDSLGHDAGDIVLKVITTRLKKIIRAEDTLSRLGGDEFTILLEDLIEAENASSICDKILLDLALPITIDDQELYVSSSIGISIFPDDGMEYTSLLKFADSAMYKAKAEGRNNYQYYDSKMTELAFEKVVMEASIRAGIKNEEFIVYYQAQVDGKTNTLIGMEALVRWEHPTMGLVSPVKFIPLAESTGLIVELDKFVMKNAMEQLVKWYKDGLNPGVLALNLAIKQLQEKNCIVVLENLLKETGCKAQWIELEVTEGQIMINPEEAAQKLQGISNIGIELAIDDFGTGYSSLAYLKRLPIDKLKIDQAFIKDLPYGDEDVGISKAVIALAKSLNLRIIAEGVETIEQKDFLIEHGCENIQGYYYSKPVPAHEFEVILRNGFKG